jgi:hypothetical protein
MKPVSDRELVYQEIIESRKAQLAEEAAQEPGPVIEAEIETAPPEVEPEPRAQEVSQETTSETTEPAPQQEEETGTESPAPVVVPKTVKAKVDDVEYDVPQEEIDKAGSLAMWQMEKAAQNRLKKLNDTIKQLEAQRQPAPQAQPQQNHDAELLQQLEALRYGEPEQAVQILKSLRTPPQVPIDQITEATVRRVEWDSAVKEFMKENGDLLKDPDLQVIAVARENLLKQHMQQTKQWPDVAKFYKDLGADLRLKYGKPAAVDLEKRREQKEAIVEPKTASGRVPTPPPPKAKTTADIINEQRKARGQPIH